MNGARWPLTFAPSQLAWATTSRPIDGQYDVVAVCLQDRQLHCARQLESCSRPLSRIKLKLFGSSGVGKTALIEALKCGYLGGLLRSTFRTPPSSTVAETPTTVFRSTYPGTYIHTYVLLSVDSAEALRSLRIRIIVHQCLVNHSYKCHLGVCSWQKMTLVQFLVRFCKKTAVFGSFSVL